MPFLAIDWYLDSTRPGSLIDWGSAASLRLESPGPMEIKDGLEVQSSYIGYEPKSRGTNGKPIPLLQLSWGCFQIQNQPALLLVRLGKPLSSCLGRRRSPFKSGRPDQLAPQNY